MKELHFVPGLASVTFRQLTPHQIIALASAAGLSALEWGGDVHVPPGQPELARTVGEATREAGLAVCSYGSYYRVGTGRPQPPFEQIAETALLLGARNIRIWAGNRETLKSSDLQKLAITEALAVAAMAHQHGLTISYEMHAGSLTENATSCRWFLEKTRHPATRILWQPEPSRPLESSLENLRSVLGHLQHVHVFFWRNGVRLPLEDGTDFWGPHFDLLKTAMPSPLPLLMEFVPDNDPGILAREAATLRRWLAMP